LIKNSDKQQTAPDNSFSIEQCTTGNAKRGGRINKKLHQIKQNRLKPPNTNKHYI
jgi:hypothetical protein